MSAARIVGFTQPLTAVALLATMRPASAAKTPYKGSIASTTTIRFFPGATASTSQAWVAYGSSQVHSYS